jgi:hypothetical protein
MEAYEAIEEAVEKQLKDTLLLLDLLKRKRDMA